MCADQVVAKGCFLRRCRSQVPWDSSGQRIFSFGRPSAPLELGVVEGSKNLDCRPHRIRPVNELQRGQRDAGYNLVAGLLVDCVNALGASLNRMVDFVQVYRGGPNGNLRRCLEATAKQRRNVASIWVSAGGSHWGDSFH